jgi:hypothetical protein
MQQHIAFAKAQGKPVAVCEAAMGGKADGSQGVFDDGEFPSWLAGFGVK